MRLRGLWAIWRREWWGNRAYSRTGQLVAPRMLPAETFSLRKRLLNLSNAKPKQKVDDVSVTFELFMETHYCAKMR